MESEIEADKPSLLMRTLEALYNLALSSPKVFAADVTVESELDLEKTCSAADTIIRNHIMMAAATGFVSNIGGLITLPVAIPANIAGVTMIQFRMFQQICRVFRVDPRDEKVRTFAMAALLGSAGVELVEEALAVVGTKLATGLLTKLPAPEEKSSPPAEVEPPKAEPAPEPKLQRQEPKVKISRRARPITVDGKLYPSIQAAADATGIPYQQLRLKS